jgi:hypothetical protein
MSLPHPRQHPARRILGRLAASALLSPVLLALFAVDAVAQRRPSAAAPPEPPPAQNWWNNIYDWLQQPVVLGIIKGLAILLVGWLLAKAIAWVIYKALCKTTWDDKLAEKLGLNMLLGEKAKSQNSLERFVAKVVYYLLLLLVLVGALEFTGLTQVAAPIQGLVDSFFRAIPALAKAGAILAVAYVAGLILKKVVSFSTEKMDSRFAELTESKEGDEKPFSQSLSTIVFWLAMVFGLVGALDALAIDAISQPLSTALAQLVGVLPDVAKAALIGAGGYVLGRIARTVVSNLTASVGVDKIPPKLKLENLFQTHKLSQMLGLLVFWFIMLQAMIAALNALRLETLSAPLTQMMSRFWAMLPSLVVAAIIIGVGVVAGRLLRGVVEATLKNLGFDKIMEKLGFGELANRNEKLNEPSEFVGAALQVGIILLAAAQALATLGLVTWSDYVNVFLGYMIKHALVSVIIIMIGFAVSNYVRDLIVGNGSDESRRWAAGIARYAVLVFAFTMAIHHLDVAPSFVLIAFALLFGALCLALALAFGLGSQKVAADIVQRQYDKAKPGIEKAKK